MGEVVAALCRGLSNRGVKTYIITLNLQRKFMEHSGMSKEEYIENLYHLPRDKIKFVDSSLFENYMSAYDGDPRATAAEFQRQIKRFLIGEILSKHEGRGIIHSHDWMAGGIITAFAKLRSIPVLHTFHNSHSGLYTAGDVWRGEFERAVEQLIRRQRLRPGMCRLPGDARLKTRRW